MTYQWHIKLTPVQFERLKKALLTYFRFSIRLSFDTIKYDLERHTLFVYIPKLKYERDFDKISCYINGFGEAIK